jgi:hypothetical protein
MLILANMFQEMEGMTSKRRGGKEDAIYSF